MQNKLSYQKLKLLKKLHLKKYRQEMNCFLLEGEKIIQEALNKASKSVQTILVTEGKNHNFDTFEDILIADKKQMKSLSQLTTPSNCIAVLEKPNFDTLRSDFILFLDDIQNPGNLGTIIRLAAWFGIYDIVCSPKTVDVYNSKVIQATMGSIFDVNIHYKSADDFFSSNSKKVYGASMSGENFYSKAYSSKSVLVIGNEGKGISENTAHYVDEFVSIPKIGKGESLNAAMATGILVSEMRKP